jgi:formamidopyrimidine-DNA glycosylase
MPELPEVQTTVDGINKEVASLSIIDVWTDYNSLFHAGKNNIKNPEYFAHFKQDVIGAKIKKASRVGKNILIHLSNGKTILTHMKMTGHYMYGKYVLVRTPHSHFGVARSAAHKMRTAPSILQSKETWEPAAKDGPLRDPFNRHIHLVFTLSDGKHLAFSDLRKFAKVFVFDTENEKTIEDLIHIGPDPLSSDFTFTVFKEQLSKRKTWKIKQALMEQSLIAGIGNIYSDEMLWISSVHPLSTVGNIPEKELKEMYKSAKPLLQRGIDFGGDSDSDYRNIYGEPGKFQNKHNAYRRTDEPCPKRGCKGTIKRLKVGGRSAHFCDTHQKLFK